MENVIIDNNNQLYLKWINDEIGWGVFSKNGIKTGQPIEFCYYYPITITVPEYDVFVFSIDNRRCVLFGYGSIYNHSNEPNSAWNIIDNEKNILVFYALKDIKAEEEITHNYGKSYWKHKSNKGKTII